MADEDAWHRCITQFMVDTCRTAKNESLMAHPLFHFSMANLVNSGDIFPSGSSAEFYIKPPLSCLDDTDIMMIVNGALAIPCGHTTPVESLDCAQDTFTVYEIIDSHKPGYVYLRKSHILKRNDNGLYLREITIADSDFLATHIIYYHTPQFFNQDGLKLSSLLKSGPAPRQGPATKHTITLGINYKLTLTKSLVNFDFVPSVRCPIWPQIASDWATRNRDHGWPDQKTISLVIYDACDVVQAVHPSCRQDEWMIEYQWRLSFSRAEVTLLNSWTPVQQIVYHMLRVILKSEIFSKLDDSDPNLPKLSNYHIKTLMLWECEQQPQSWWSAESSLVKLCSSLLYKLSDWIKDRHCRHYFISNCNLLDHLDEDISPMFVKRLADERFMLSWFTENYVRKCAQSCPVNVSSLFEDIRSSAKLKRAMHAVVKWEQSLISHKIYTERYECEKMVLSILLMYRVDAIDILTYMKEMRYFDNTYRNYFIAVTSLQVAYTIPIHSLTEDLLEVLWTLFDPCTSSVCETARNGVQLGGILCIRKAIKLATLSRLRANALELLHNEMARAYLQYSFNYGEVTTYCVVHVLLAALYYKSGHYLTGVDHCTQAMNHHDCDTFRLCRIETEHLPQIDERIDYVVGLILFYQHIHRTMLNPNVQLRGESKLAITAELLAHYLCLRCSTVTDDNHQQMMKYRRCLIINRQPLLSDALLFKVVETKLSEIPAAVAGNPSPSLDTSLLVTSLELVALEKLITFRQAMVDELHSELCPVLNEFEALHAYKCGLFRECLEMCRNHAIMIIRSGCLLNQRFIIGLPVFFSQLDGELLSLIGVIRLSHPVLVLSLLEFLDSESIALLTVLLYLMTQCQRKLRSDALCDTLQLVRYVHDKLFPADDAKCFVDRLILKLIYRSSMLYVDECLIHAVGD